MAVKLSPWPPDTSVAALASARTCLRAELGRAAVGLNDMQLDRLGGAAAAEVEVFAAPAPQALKDQAVVMMVGWLAQVPPHLTAKAIKSPDGSEISLSYSRGMSTASPLRASGASSILARHRRMGAGVISGSPSSSAQAEVPEPVDLGTTVMRCGFSDVLPHPQSMWRWVGTVNGVELDTAWTQPASFAFWIPGDLMQRVVAVALLRSIPGGTQGDRVTLSSFGPAEAYMFGNTLGMLRATPVTFTGQFSPPNDFRALLL